MRSMIVAMGLAAFAIGALVEPAAAAKTKMGCEKGKEIWNAAEGKCVPGRYSNKSSGKAAKAKKAAE
jgi:hypothetical protein